MKITKETELILDAIAMTGYYIDILDASGVYIYNSKNSDFDIFPIGEALGKTPGEMFGLTEETSLLLRTLKTGVPSKDSILSYKSRTTGKTHLWWYNTYPIYEDRELVAVVGIYRPFSEMKGLVEELEGLTERKNNSPAGIHINSKTNFDSIIHQSMIMDETINIGKKAAKSNANVLIIGETGTGKELFAKSIHNSSSRKNKPFVAVNCAAIPDTLLESIMFGVAKGAYTGAVEKKGLFEESNEGTIFLDEIHTLSPEMQAKLLRVLEYGTLRRVGGNKEITINSRIITAMNRDPYVIIQSGSMKADLFYRVSTLTVQIPPLRERKDDILILVNNFIKEINKKSGSTIKECSPAALRAMQSYDWPGNVRELQHAVEYASVLMENENVIGVDHLPKNIIGSKMADEFKEKTEKIFFPNGSFNPDYKEAYQDAFEKFNDLFIASYVSKALKKNGGNISKTASSMNISRQYLHRLIKKCGLNITDL